MIGSIKHKGLKELYLTGETRKVPPEMIARIELILGVMAVADRLESINMPTFKLHALKGDRKGQFAVTVKSNWRIVFRFEDGFAEEVDFVDYH